jgi:hypothetical protein
MVSLYRAMLECDGIWRAWEEGMECWFFSYRPFNASIWEWRLQGIWKLIFFLWMYLEINMVQFRSLFPKLRKKSLVMFSQMSSTKITCYITTWVGGSFTFIRQLTAEMIVVSDGHSEY